MNPILDILKRTCAILDDRRRWTTKVYARDSRGLECLPVASSAVCWCAVGAIQKAAAEVLGAGDEAWDLADAAMAYVVECSDDAGDPDVMSYESQIADVNDRQGHAAVLRLMAGAVAHLEMTGAADVR